MLLNHNNGLCNTVSVKTFWGLWILWFLYLVFILFHRWQKTTYSSTIGCSCLHLFVSNCFVLISLCTEAIFWGSTVDIPPWAKQSSFSICPCGQERLTRDNPKLFRHVINVTIYSNYSWWTGKTSMKWRCNTPEIQKKISKFQTKYIAMIT